MLISQLKSLLGNRFWELLKHKNLNKQHVTLDDLIRYKKILLTTNVHLEGYLPGEIINVTGWKTFDVILAPLNEIYC